MSIRALLISIVFCGHIFSASAQKENYIWAFGNGIGLNFNTSGTPSLFLNNMSAYEGSATVCDANGQLLFYSDGTSVWDRQQNVMPGGTGILGNKSNGSATQGVVIIPSLSDSGSYYLFTVDAAEDKTGVLRYTVVDMKRNNGMGDVDITRKNIVLDNNVSEKMVAVQGEGCYYWLLVHMIGSTEFKAYKIDKTGVQSPVSSFSGLLSYTASTNPSYRIFYWSGGMKIAPDNKTLANIQRDDANNNASKGVELHQFDNKTGMVSNAIPIDTSSGMIQYYGLCFSPDGTKLYASMFNAGVFQFDLALLPNVAAVMNSKMKIGSVGYEMRAGPDGKIYTSDGYLGSYLNIIDQPNQPAMACNFMAKALKVPNLTTSLGMGSPTVPTCYGQNDNENIAAVPGAFSPNGDGANDILYVRGNNIKDLELKIFNRWGQLVFESRDKALGWDGSYKGVVQDSEALAYILLVVFNDGTPYQSKGNITIIR